jgi:hypothetical protein
MNPGPPEYELVVISQPLNSVANTTTFELCTILVSYNECGQVVYARSLERRLERGGGQCALNTLHMTRTLHTPVRRDADLQNDVAASL